VLCCASADYDDELDAFYVPVSPSLKKRWSEFFDLRRFQLATVSGVLHETRSSWDGSKFPCLPCYTGCSTLGVLEQMARLGTHRVAILTDEGRVHGLITQSMLISLFTQEMERLGALRNVLVSDIIPMLAAGAHVVTEDVLTINALRKMARCRVAGLGVVNASGSLVGSISVSDLQGLGCEAEQFERLWHPVRVFLWKQSPVTPSTVLLTDTLETVIRKMEDGYVHLVFVVAEPSRGAQLPLFAITQRDLLRVICSKMGLGNMR
jgi:CBS-domain-containing membrane protein